MKLEIDLIPRTSFYDNVRSEVPKKKWDELRRACYMEAGYLCEICFGRGMKHPVECHEVWEYDTVTGIQKLIKLIALCPMCHKSKHYGLARKIGMEEVVIKHLMKVNRATRPEIEKHVVQAFELWRTRNQIKWKLDLTAIGIET